MNRYNFQQTGGFPLETDTLNNMQVAYSLFNALGEISGNKTIVTGCNEVAGVVTDGVVYLNGELVEFRGGSIQTHVRLIEIPTSKEFEDGSFKEVYYERYVTFSSGPDEIPWSEFTRLISVSEIQKRLVPIGVINMWSGAINEIPQGWALCDGTNNTPDLSGKFIVGVNPSDTDFNTVGKIGGDKTFTLAMANLPAFGVPYRDSYMISNSTTAPGINGVEVLDGNYYGPGGGETNKNRLLYRNNTTSALGNGTSKKHLPPYYTLAFIQFKGY